MLLQPICDIINVNSVSHVNHKEAQKNTTKIMKLDIERKIILNFKNNNIKLFCHKFSSLIIFFPIDKIKINTKKK
jgi:ABC-type tungstate transport system permease subunit